MRFSVDAKVHASVDAKVQEALGKVSEAIDCACCFEVLGAGVTFVPTVHNYCAACSQFAV
jgi:hypothetical protein